MWAAHANLDFFHLGLPLFISYHKLGRHRELRAEVLYKINKKQTKSQVASQNQKVKVSQSFVFWILIAVPNIKCRGN